MEKRKVPSLQWLYPVAIAFLIAPGVGLGIYLIHASGNWIVLTGALAALAALLAAWPITHAIEAARDAHLQRLSDLSASVNERIQQVNTLLNSISEQQLISDRTKQVAYRTRDREALRRAIHEEVGNKDWEAAQALVSDMERLFGYKQEADRFRQEIEQVRQTEVRKQVNEGTAVIERHVRAELWQDALAEAHKLSQQYPSDEQARTMPQQVEQRRVQHKRQLIESWHEAINRHDIDGSIEILRRLDPYLTPQEAEAMQEPARNLFKEKLNALRTQITLAVQDHRWSEALRLGEQIINDFPNTRAAQEVRDMMPQLRERGTTPSAVAT